MELITPGMELITPGMKPEDDNSYNSIPSRPGSSTVPGILRPRI